MISFGACGSKDLSRSEAKEIIGKAAKFPSPVDMRIKFAQIANIGLGMGDFLNYWKE
jgi:hypothetical protein